MLITVLATLAALAQGAPGSAAGLIAPPIDETSAALQDSDRIVCKSERALGSRMSKQTCRTKKEWAEAAAAFRASADRHDAAKRRGSQKFAK